MNKSQHEHRIVYHVLSSKPLNQLYFSFFFSLKRRSDSLPLLKHSSIFTASFTPERWTTVHCFMHSKSNVYLFKIHIHWTHNQRAVQWDRDSAYRCISLEARNTPIWYKEISYGNLVGDSIVSYGPQRMHEQCLLHVLNWLELNKLKCQCTSFHCPDRVPIFEWMRQTSICWR